LIAGSMVGTKGITGRDQWPEPIDTKKAALQKTAFFVYVSDPVINSA